LHAKPGKSMPVDTSMQQENVVRHLKELINPQSSHNLEEFHPKTLAPLVMILLDFKREMREDVTDRTWGGHHMRRDTAVDVRHLVGRMTCERLFKYTSGRGVDDEAVKVAKDWVFEGQVILEEGEYWQRFVKTSLRELDLDDDDDQEEGME
jgi:hypothetical protein